MTDSRYTPCPCCGNLRVSIHVQNMETRQMFCAVCSECGMGADEESVSRTAALYKYEQYCLGVWKKHPNGLNDWLNGKTKNPEDFEYRNMIRYVVQKRLMESGN